MRNIVTNHIHFKVILPVSKIRVYSCPFVVKKSLLAVFLFSLAFPLLAADPIAFQLTHRDTSEYRSTAAGEGECHIAFTLTGGQLKAALEAGQWEITEATDNTGAPLILLDGYADNFQPLKKNPAASGPDSATVKLGLTNPSRAATSIQTLKGSLGINVYRRQVVIIEDLDQNLNQLIENPLFQAHDFTVQVIDPQHAYPGYSSATEKAELLSRAVALRIEGEIDKVDSFTLVAPDGTEIPTRAAGFGAGRSRIMALMADTPLPAGTTAHLLIPIDPKEIRIPFSFTNIQLP
jgi:hypothetical protein